MILDPATHDIFLKKYLFALKKTYIVYNSKKWQFFFKLIFEKGVLQNLFLNPDFSQGYFFYHLHWYIYIYIYSLCFVRKCTTRALTVKLCFVWTLSYFGQTFEARPFYCFSRMCYEIFTHGGNKTKQVIVLILTLILSNGYHLIQKGIGLCTILCIYESKIIKMYYRLYIALGPLCKTSSKYKYNRRKELNYSCGFCI